MNPRLAVETMLLRWALMDRVVDLEEVLEAGGGTVGPVGRRARAAGPRGSRAAEYVDRACVERRRSRTSSFRVRPPAPQPRPPLRPRPSSRLDRGDSGRMAGDHCCCPGAKSLPGRAARRGGTGRTGTPLAQRDIAGAQPALCGAARAGGSNGGRDPHPHPWSAGAAPGDRSQLGGGRPATPPAPAFRFQHQSRALRSSGRRTPPSTRQPMR